MISVTPVVVGLEPYELKIGGPENNQPQFFTLHALRATDGRVMSRWRLTEEERQAVANGADLYLTLYTEGRYPPTRLEVNLSDAPDSVKTDMRLDEELSLRLLAGERDKHAHAYREANKAFEQKVAEIYGEQIASNLGGGQKIG